MARYLALQLLRERRPRLRGTHAHMRRHPAADLEHRRSVSGQLTAPAEKAVMTGGVGARASGPAEAGRLRDPSAEARPLESEPLLGVVERLPPREALRPPPRHRCRCGAGTTKAISHDQRMRERRE